MKLLGSIHTATSIYLIITISRLGLTWNAFAFLPERISTFTRSPTLFSNREQRLFFSSTDISPSENNDSRPTVSDYWNAIRPYTITQAVGALVVGQLALVSSTTATFRCRPGDLLAAAASVYLSYGAGMAMNDCADVDVDALHTSKHDRAIASGRITKRAGWAFCLGLGSLSLVLARFVGNWYCLWTVSNLTLMLGYALRLQRIFLMKNIVCGWLAISPLVGAALWSGNVSLSKLIPLAAVGFPIQVSREILKDIEDVEIDKGNKVTLPLVVGEKLAHCIAYTMVGIVCSAMVFTPLYWNMFESYPPVYAVGVMAGVPMCIRASLLPLKKGEKLLKKSIYVLLAGMIGSLLLQR